MVQSSAPTVDAYLADATIERRPILERLRVLARHVLAGHEEQMAFGMPTYLRNGRAEFAFADQKRHLALYVMKPGVLAGRAESLSRLDHGKGCIRFGRSAAIDWVLIERLLTDTRDSSEPPCQGVRRPNPQADRTS